MTREAVNGVELAYKDFGAGMPVLCLHGGMGIDSVYLDISGIRFLVDRNCRVIIYDQRGHGLSGRSDEADYRHGTWIKDARGLAQHLGLGQFVLLGTPTADFSRSNSRFAGPRC